MTTAWLGLGSNLGDRRAHLRAILRGLEARDVRVLARSSLYETEPLHYRDQGWFLNAVVAVEGPEDPAELLRICQEIEIQEGRRRDLPCGPRTADVDVLLFGDRVLDTPDLQIPHPRMAGRLFVLVPLLEIAPDAADPRTGEPYARARDALTAAPGQAIRKVAPPEAW